MNKEPRIKARVQTRLERLQIKYGFSNDDFKEIITTVFSLEELLDVIFEAEKESEYITKNDVRKLRSDIFRIINSVLAVRCLMGKIEEEYTNKQTDKEEPVMNEKEKEQIIEKIGIDESQLDLENFVSNDDDPETIEEVDPDE